MWRKVYCRTVLSRRETYWEPKTCSGQTSDPWRAKCKTPSKVVLNSLDDLPEKMLEENGNITLVLYIMYINKINFIVTTSRAIHFGTVEMIKDNRKATLMKSLQQVICTYHSRWFRVLHILANRQFECIIKPMELMGITINSTAHDEHVPEFERYIRMTTIWKRTRAWEKRARSQEWATTRAIPKMQIHKLQEWTL